MDIERLRELRGAFDSGQVTDQGYAQDQDDILALIDAEFARQSVKSEEVAEAIELFDGAIKYRKDQEEEVKKHYGGKLPDFYLDLNRKETLAITALQAYRLPSAIKWTGDNLREVINLTGWNESASSIWTWKKYEQVVKEKGLKIFTPDGSVIADIGSWIVRDGNDCFVLQEYEPAAIPKTETTSARALSCWYCTEIEKHGVVAVKTVLDKAGRELDAYETPYNYCPNCGRKLD